jgi:protein-tyrosine phosphatase
MALKVLMVCLGNICRSPLAEGILQSFFNKNDVFVDSAGTGDWHVGEKPDHRSISVAKKHGIDISSQKCRQITQKDFFDFDVIFAMDKDNVSNILQLAPNENLKKKVFLILDVLENGVLEVPDPYYGTSADFEKVFQLLLKACKIHQKKFLLHTHDNG